MRTNSRLPIDLAELSVVEFHGSSPGHPDSNPDYSLDVVPTSRGPGAGPDAWAFGLLSSWRRPEGGLGRNEARGRTAARSRRAHRPLDVYVAGLPVAVSARANR